MPQTEGQRPTVIFLHMPKSGGSTLNHVLDWNYDRVFTASVYSRIPALIALPEEERRRLQCVKGMLYYGIHRHLPQPTTYITILRHPVERTISHYFYHFRRKERLGEPVPERSLEEFLALEPFQATYQLHTLVGADHDDPQHMLREPLPPDALDRAKQHIETHFTLAGVLEYYDESLLLMKRALGWQRAFYARQNVNPQRAARRDIAPETIAMLERACAPEIELYDYVKARFEATLAEEIAQRGDAFQRELAALRRANRRFELLRRVTHPIYDTRLWHIMRRTARNLSRLRD